MDTRNFFLVSEKLKIVIRTVTTKHNREIIKYLATVKEATVSQVWISLRIEQSTASSNLGKLQKFGLLTSKRVGSNVYYRLNTDAIEKLESNAEILLEHAGDPVKKKKYEARKTS